MTPVRRHVSYANVVSTLALFVALGGSSYAAINLPKGSVGSRELRADGVRERHLSSGAVDASSLRTGAVRRRHIGAGQIVGTHIQDGSLRLGDLLAADLKKLSESMPAGPAGATGARGPQGPPGPAGE